MAVESLLPGECPFWSIEVNKQRRTQSNGSDCNGGVGSPVVAIASGGASSRDLVVQEEQKEGRLCRMLARRGRCSGVQKENTAPPLVSNVQLDTLPTVKL